VAVSVAAGTVGAEVAGRGVEVSVTAAAVETGGKVAMVGIAGVVALHARTASRTANPPSRIFNVEERIKYSFI
jgi:hypothetical protein